jgi:two-component system response regulator
MRPVTVLLVEDNEGDAALVAGYFESASLPVDLRRAGDGVDALDYLARARMAQPDLILLDLNMPRMDGHALLRRLKADGSPWRAIPVVLLTTSAAEEDILGSYTMTRTRM